MESGLIGYTGFVGSNLYLQRAFYYVYNSKNFHKMKGQSYGEIVCAGITANKWQANKAPETDRAKIKELQDVLATVSAKRFILISTIDVYPVMQEKTETFDCHSVANHAYGTHRLAFEDFCRERFSNCFIVRLPGLFGNGLKKNLIFDLLNDNCLEMINPGSSFQYYYLRNLWTDIQIAIKAEVRLINLFTEPVATSEIIERFFPGKRVGQNPLPEVHYNLHSCHADLWGKSGPYIYTNDEILKHLSEFIENYSREN